MIASGDIRNLAAIALESACNCKTCPVYFQTCSAPRACPFDRLRTARGAMPCNLVRASDWLDYFDRETCQ